MADLKPCPFCGGEAKIERHDQSDNCTVYVCRECGCTLPSGDWRDGSSWNDRVCDNQLASLRQQLAEAREDGKLFNTLVSNSWDLRCISVPTGGDDYDIDWLVIEHHQAEPHERTIAQAYKDDPRAAILRAMRATDPNAERCVSCDEVLHDGDSVYHEHGEGGHIHSWCVDDPDSFVDEDGEPAPSKPTPFAYSALPHPDREGEWG